jgi:sulfhydrogenase subunit alpha
VQAQGRTITLSHLGRVEGHGAIRLRIAGGVVEEVKLDVLEGSRYYEALLKGKHFLEVQGIITRVCAICSASHTVAALTALEKALDVHVSPRVHDLRGLLVLGSTIESHALHVFALALPDFLGFDSVIAMAGGHRDVVSFALRLKQLGNRIQELVGGRAVHPVNTLVGGFARLPSRAALEGLRAELQATLDPLMDAVDLLAGIPVPEVPSPQAVFVALRPYEEAYRMRGDTLCTSDGRQFPAESYREVVREFAVEHSHAKHARLSSGEAYMVGALARLHLWSGLLSGRARRAFGTLFPGGVRADTMLNTWAQLVELVHCVEHADELCARLLEGDPAESEMTSYDVRPGAGVGALEAPRGTLFHEYEIDREGRVASANVVTPTAQNLVKLEGDMRSTAERLIAADAAAPRLELSLQMLARAYDPCISCAVHVIWDR